MSALNLCAAQKAAPETPPLSEVGQKLFAQYTELLKGLKAEITRAVPGVDEQKKAVFLKAREAAKAALEDANAKQKAFADNQSPKGLLEHRKNWVRKAEKAMAAAEERVKKATGSINSNNRKDAAKDFDEAQKALADAQADRLNGLSELKKSQEAVNKAKIDEPKLIQANQTAQATLAQARTHELAAARAILADFEPFLSSDKQDAQLVKCALLAEATPHGLAEFAQQGKEQEALVESLLANDSLMKQMLESGGAQAGKFGQAMLLYTAIQKASLRANEGILQRLALGTSLEHAVPVKQRRAETMKDAPAIVDPVKRYLHYEQAYLNGELDPAFNNMTVWECRMIVNSDAPDRVLAWGREMLRNYRPDHIINPDYGWRYSMAVRTDVAYRHSNEYKDVDSLEFFQNVIKNGGICGRRAFFGRFIIQSFGLPAWGVSQHAHAAVGRWTPAGWVINLGANWQWSWYEGRTGPDFLLETQARKDRRDYLKVLRAQWVGDALGEQRYDSMREGSGGWWNVMALYQKKVIVAEAKPVELSALGQELAEANEAPLTNVVAMENVPITDADKKIGISNGVITIPAAACSHPSKNTGGVLFMRSFLGGLQLHCRGETFSYDVEVPNAGKYALTVRVVTVHESLRLQLTPNKAKGSIDMVLPYTCGLWQKTEPVEVSLVQGKNVLTFSNPTNSFTIKDFTLTPVK